MSFSSSSFIDEETAHPRNIFQIINDILLKLQYVLEVRLLSKINVGTAVDIYHICFVFILSCMIVKEEVKPVI